MKVTHRKTIYLNGIDSLKKNISTPANFEMKTAASGKHFFNLKAGNGEVISTSAMWDSLELRETWMNKLKTDVLHAAVMEIKK